MITLYTLFQPIVITTRTKDATYEQISKRKK